MSARTIILLSLGAAAIVGVILYFVFRSNKRVITDASEKQVLLAIQNQNMRAGLGTLGAGELDNIETAGGAS